MKERSILVVGGGIAGVQASLELAQMGYSVYLLEEGSSIGGRMAKLDKTFPTNDCSICILAPKLVEAGRNLHINILTFTTLLSLEGKEGDFYAKILKKPRYVNIQKCVGCGICAQKCPVKVEDSFNEALGKRKAIYIEYPQAVPLAYCIDKKHCLYLREGRCGVCKKVCPADAINFEDEEIEETLSIGAVILTCGASIFDATKKHTYGYRKYNKVFTSTELERLLSATGPTRGEIEKWEKVAFIQCVGSRDTTFNPYCSSVCCMYAIKEAILIKERIGADVCIFGMDVRTYSKGFSAYYKKALDEGVRFKRTRPAYINEKNGRIYLYYEEDGLKNEVFDAVILSVGFLQKNEAFSEVVGVSLNEWGFFETKPFEPVSTKREGVFVAGILRSPKDIPETVVEAAAAAACAAKILKGKRYKISEEVLQMSLSPHVRIGVFVCHCGINIASYIDVESLKEFAKTLPHVVYATTLLFACSQDAQKRIKDAVLEQRLNRVIVAACTPRTHEPLFQQTLKEIGLNPYLFEMANIRDQCSWVHKEQDALSKAKHILFAAVKKAALLEEASIQKIPVLPAVLVIGAGPAGTAAALCIAEAGYKVYLVEKEENIGGRLRKIRYRVDEASIKDYLKQIEEKITSHPNIELYLKSEIKEFSGYIGNFKAKLEGVHNTPLTFGAVIVATGAEEEKPFGKYFYGESLKVLLQSELEELICEGKVDGRSIVMIQCVNSLPQETYCSRYCCIEAVKNALRLRKMRKDVFIIYKDMRTYGFFELYYQKAREEGVIFLRTEDQEPFVEIKDKVIVKFYETTLRKHLLIEADYLVLTTRMVPRKESEKLSSILKIPLTAEGFFLEAHPKLRPVDAQDGIFLAGACSYPMLIDEAIAQGLAAASGVMKILAREEIEIGGIVASVIEERCASCLCCVRTCPYNAPKIGENGTIVIETARCQGCGMCVAICPAKALKLKNLEDLHINALVEGLLHGV